MTWAPQPGYPFVWDTNDIPNWQDSLGHQADWQDGDTAVFKTPGSATVPVSGNVKISGITFQAGSWTITAGSAAHLSLYQSNALTPITVDNPGTVAQYTVVNDTIAAEIVANGSSSGLEITGPGTVA